MTRTGGIIGSYPHFLLSFLLFHFRQGRAGRRGTPKIDDGLRLTGREDRTDRALSSPLLGIGFVPLKRGTFRSHTRKTCY